jgi:hypothetical protein
MTGLIDADRRKRHWPFSLHCSNPGSLAKEAGTEAALFQFGPPACLRAKRQLARRGADHGHIIGLID